MISIFLGDVVQDIEMYGEVKKQFYSKWANFITVLTLLTVFLPLITFIFLPKSVGDTPRWILFSFTCWQIVGIYSISVLKSPSKLLRLFISKPAKLYIKLTIYFLEKKYPNTDDPNEILKFNRKLKIKNIL